MVTITEKDGAVCVGQISAHPAVVGQLAPNGPSFNQDVWLPLLGLAVIGGLGAGFAATSNSGNGNSNNAALVGLFLASH